MSVVALSRQSGVSPPTNSNIELRGGVPNVRTAERLLGALDHELEVVHNGKA